MSAATKQVPYGVLLKQQCDCRVVVGSIGTHAPAKPLRRHLRVVMWFNVTPMALEYWYRSTHCDSGVAQEQAVA